MRLSSLAHLAGFLLEAAVVVVVVVVVVAAAVVVSVDDRTLPETDDWQG